MHIELIKSMLHQQIETARQKNDMLDHVLFYGPNGLGQQQLADLLIREMDVEQETYLALPDHQAADFLERVVNVPDGGILLIDNLHRLSRLSIPILEVVMAEAVERNNPDMTINRSAVGLTLPRFTVIGTTTNLRRVSPVLQEQFGVMFRVDM